jgi:hypothetical protein
MFVWLCDYHYLISLIHFNMNGGRNFQSPHPQYLSSFLRTTEPFDVLNLYENSPTNVLVPLVTACAPEPLILNETAETFHRCILEHSIISQEFSSDYSDDESSNLSEYEDSDSAPKATSGICHLFSRCIKFTKPISINLPSPPPLPQGHYIRICHILNHLSSEVEYDSDIVEDVRIAELISWLLCDQCTTVEDVNWQVS